MAYERQVQGAMDRLDQSLARLHTMIKRGENESASRFMLEGELKENCKVSAEVDRYRRGQMRRSHTSTHLLNAALRQIVDPSIKQAGSLVTPDRLRFDFNYYEAFPKDLLHQIEQVVNHEIMRNTFVETNEMLIEL